MDALAAAKWKYPQPLIFVTFKNITMNQKNFEYLRDQIKFTGFGLTLEDALRDKLESQPDAFQLYYRWSCGTDESVATLFFRRSTQSDLYFFNKYELILKRTDTPDVLKRAFYMGKENNFTLKEAYNMMCGRSVHKELTNLKGARYSSWVQLDLRQTNKNGDYKLKYFHDNYGFDLVKELERYPIRELENEERKRGLVASLYKGNRHAVAWIEDGAETIRFIEANPRFKSLRIYDANHQRIGNVRNRSMVCDGGSASAREVPTGENEGNAVDEKAAGKTRTEAAGAKKTKRKPKGSASGS